MLRRLIHFLLRRHSWTPSGFFRAMSFDGFSYWEEEAKCPCGASCWDITQAATRARIESYL